MLRRAAASLLRPAASALGGGEGAAATRALASTSAPRAPVHIEEEVYNRCEDAALRALARAPPAAAHSAAAAR
jgi:hypothetical protein